MNNYRSVWEELVMDTSPPYGEFNYENHIFKLKQEENIAREKRAKWIIPGFDPKKHKIISQGENKMAGLEGYTITNGPLTGNWAVGVDWATTKYRQVKIDKVTNGFIVEIGCKKFVAENWKSLAFKLEEYWKDPVAAEEKYAK